MTGKLSSFSRKLFRWCLTYVWLYSLKHWPVPVEVPYKHVAALKVPSKHAAVCWSALFANSTMPFWGPRGNTRVTALKLVKMGNFCLSRTIYQYQVVWFDSFLVNDKYYRQSVIYKFCPNPLINTWVTCTALDLVRIGNFIEIHVSYCCPFSWKNVLSAHP